MRVLYITNDFPFPLTSGHLRHYYLLRELARAHDVSLASIVRPDFSETDAAALEPFVERMVTRPSSTQGRSTGEKLRNQIRAVVRREPVEHAAIELRDAVAALRRAVSFDAAVLCGRRTTPLLDALDGIPVVADLCDADSMRIRASLRYSRARQRPALMVEYARVRRAERALIRVAHHHVFASCRDRDALVGPAAPNTTVVPNGVDLDYWTRTRPERGTDTIVFTGAMRYPPNTDAALWLIDRILPLVRRVRPTANALIVGRDPPPRLRQAGERAHVIVTGSVEDVRPYLEDGTVFVAPLRFGAGIQNKVLEALAMELPVVASPVAAAGLLRDDGSIPPLRVASTAREFAAAITDELAAADTDPSARAAGRRFVATRHDWALSARLLEQALDAAVSNAQRCVQSVQPMFLPGRDGVGAGKPVP